MWPRGSTRAQLATIDDRLDALRIALRESGGCHEDTLVAELRQRLNELLDDRNRVAAMLPQQRREES